MEIMDLHRTVYSLSKELTKIDTSLAHFLPVYVWNDITAHFSILFNRVRHKNKPDT